MKSRLARARRRAREHAVEAFTAADVAALLEIQNGLCAGHWYGKDIRKAYAVDHKIPLARGGTGDRSNLQLLCKSCNLRKHTRTMDEWLQAILLEQGDQEGGESASWHTP